jgi:hypothetical protein
MTQDMENLRKKNKTDAKRNGRPIQQNRTKQKTESQNLKMKW